LIGNLQFSSQDQEVIAGWVRNASQRASLHRKKAGACVLAAKKQTAPATAGAAVF
jgi:hypothetical protein